MAGSLFRKLGFSRRDESSSDSEDEVRNEFTAPSELSRPEPAASSDQGATSVFSKPALSLFTKSSRSTGFTESTSGTADTGNSLRSEGSKRHRLQVVDVEAGYSNKPANLPQTFDELVGMLRTLASKLEALDQQTNFDTAPRVSATLARLINDYTTIFKTMQLQFNPDDLPDTILSTVVCVVLGFSDVYLADETHKSARAHLIRALFHFGESLNLLNPYGDGGEGGNGGKFPSSAFMDGQATTIPQPRHFAIGSSPRPVPNENMLKMILDQFAAGSVPISEQDGAYAVPVLRGLSPRFSVATLCLGIPGMQRHHLDLIVALRSELKSLHVFGRCDSFIPASTAVPPAQSTPAGQGQMPAKHSFTYGEVKAPYRIPTDPLGPPMSISVAPVDSSYISGTLGGFVYPLVANSETMDRNIYALTCGHVCLQEEEAGSANKDNDNIMIEYPSPVLRKLFKKALVYQRDRFSPDTLQWQALDKSQANVDKQAHSVLGEVVWGERTVIRRQMSDIAVIRCEPQVRCQNWLGEDVEFSQYDPSLLMDQLRVRSIIAKSRGLEVFKYGSTSRYTSGVVSSLRTAYWANGTMQTSEFAVRSGESASFASGGDSGAWILSSTPAGLGVVGMLHSYDGEMKEFGLYSPMSTVLSRLNEVTGTPWGVLGAVTKADYLHEAGEDSE